LRQVGAGVEVLALVRCCQGLILVHFSAQPEPSLSPQSTDTTQCFPQKVSHVEPKNARV
jgi:hypothetical protein